MAQEKRKLGVGKRGMRYSFESRGRRAMLHKLSPTQAQPNAHRKKTTRITDLRCLHLTHPIRDFL